MTATMVMSSFHKKLENRTVLDVMVNNFVEQMETKGYKVAMTTVHVENDFVFITIWMAQPAVQMPPGLLVPVRTAA